MIENIVKNDILYLINLLYFPTFPVDYNIVLIYSKIRS
jgi:hypothetical protein